MSTPAEGGASGHPVEEVTQRRDRMQATLVELGRVADLDDGGDGRWPEAARAAMDEAAVTWERHVTGTESPQGILADVLEREPRLAHLVDTLRAEHTEIQAVLDETRRRLPDQDVAAARQEVQAVAARLSHHHHLGGELIHNAYHIELGGGG